MSTPITTSQTIGPFPHEAWRWAFDPRSTATAAPLVIFGVVRDGDGTPVPDAIVEAWTPGADPGPVDGLPGLIRVPSSEQGEFRLALPRRPAPGEPAAYVTVFGRGIVKHQFTAVFLPDDPGLATASLLMQVPAERRATLVATPEGDGYRWNVHLQGAHETVFLDFE